MLTGLLRWLDTAVRPGDPHPPVAERDWPGSCWYGQPGNATAHAWQVPPVKGTRC